MMTTQRARYTLLDHTADMGIRITGVTLIDLFENAAQALMDIMIERRLAGKTSPVSLTVRGEDLPDLMVRWLGEILYLLVAEEKVVLELSIHDVSDTQMDATLHTVPFDPKAHEVTTEIKAVTYHHIEVAPFEDGWQATVIFDL